jgi:hypothetical protein
MAAILVSADRVVGAPADAVYSYIADMRSTIRVFCLP